MSYIFGRRFTILVLTPYDGDWGAGDNDSRNDLIELMTTLNISFPAYENNYLAPHLLYDYFFDNRKEEELSAREESVFNWIKSCDGILVALKVGEAMTNSLILEINYASKYKKPMIFLRMDRDNIGSYLDGLYGQICNTACCDDSNILPPNHTCG
jgi:hypothetical protein